MLKRIVKTCGYVVVAMALLALVAAGVIWGIWGHFASPERIHHRVKTEFEKVARGKVQLRWAALSPTMRLRLEGVKFRPPGAEDVFFACEEADVRFARMPLLEGEVVPERLTVLRPRLFLARDVETGRWNVENILRPDAFEGPAEPPPAGLLGAGAFFEDATVLIRSQEIFKDLDPREIKGLDLQVTRRSPASETWEMRGGITRGFLRGTEIRGWFGDRGFWVHGDIRDAEINKDILTRIPVGDDIEKLFHPRGRFRGSVTVHKDAESARPSYMGRLDVRGMSSLTKFYGARMTEIAGQLLIVGGRVIFRDLSGRIPPEEFGLAPHACQPPEVRVNGYYQMHPESANVHIKAYDLPLTQKSISEIPEVGEKVWEALRPDGMADISLDVEDLPEKEPRFHVTVDLTDVGLRVKELPFDVENFVGQVRVTEENVTLRDVHGSVQQAGSSPRIALNGVFDTRGNPRDLTVDVSNLRLEENLVRAIPELGGDLWKLFQPTGVVDGSVSIRDSGQGPRVSGSIHLQNGRLKSSFSPLPLGNVSANIRFDEERIQISRLTGRIELGTGALLESSPGALLLTGEIERDGKGGAFHVEIPSLQLSQPVVEALPEVGRPLWKRLQPEGLMALYGRISYDTERENPVSYQMRMELKNSKATWAGFEATMSSLNGTILLEDDNVIIPHVSGMVAGGPFDASGFVTRDDAGTVRYTGSVEYRRLDLRRLLYELTEEETRARGRLSGLVEIGGRLGDESRLRGVGSAELSDGLVWKAPVMLGLIDVLHLSAPGQHGRFDQGKMRFSFDSRAVDLHSFRLTSPAAELTGQGTVQVPDGKLDIQMVAATLPEGGLPVIGQALRVVLRPVERQLVRVQVGGTLDDPKYKLHPLRNVTHPISSIFDLLTSPFRKDDGDGE